MRAPTLIECSWLDGRDLAGRGRIVAPSSQQMANQLAIAAQSIQRMSSAANTAAQNLSAARAAFAFSLALQKKKR